jgi:hypothetical protein
VFYIELILYQSLFRKIHNTEFETTTDTPKSTKKEPSKIFKKTTPLCPQQ